jgi:predicted CXXCH cytochrome family protein
VKFVNATTGVQLLAALACLTLMPSPAWARATSGSGLAGSPHDFTKPGNSAYQSDRDANMCIFCHVPHNGSAAARPPWDHRLTIPASTRDASGRTTGAAAPDAFDYLPLWNHELTGNHASYTMYQNGPSAPQKGAKASQAVANGMTPGSTSLLCLSCHDGSVAINSYGNNSQLSVSSGGATIGAAYVIGKDNYLGNHHPVGFDYDAVRSVDKEIRSADSATLGTAGTVRDHLYGPGSTKMECGTCHSVHNTGNTGETLLWRSDRSSRLCLTCHDKGNDPFAMIP